MGNEIIHRTVEFYDRTAGEYVARWFDRPVVEPYLDRFIPLVQDRGPVADVGCGPGRDVAYLLKHKVPTIGVDLSASMLAEARDRVPEGTYLLADIRFNHNPTVTPGLLAEECGGLLTRFFRNIRSQQN